MPPQGLEHTCPGQHRQCATPSSEDGYLWQRGKLAPRPQALLLCSAHIGKASPNCCTKVRVMRRWQRSPMTTHARGLRPCDNAASTQRMRSCRTMACASLAARSLASSRTRRCSPPDRNSNLDGELPLASDLLADLSESPPFAARMS